MKNIILLLIVVLSITSCFCGECVEHSAKMEIIFKDGVKDTVTIIYYGNLDIKNNNLMDSKYNTFATDVRYYRILDNTTIKDKKEAKDDRF